MPEFRGVVRLLADRRPWSRLLLASLARSGLSIGLLLLAPAIVAAQPRATQQRGVVTGVPESVLGETPGSGRGLPAADMRTLRIGSSGDEAFAAPRTDDTIMPLGVSFGYRVLPARRVGCLATAWNLPPDSFIRIDMAFIDPNSATYHTEIWYSAGSSAQHAFWADAELTGYHRCIGTFKIITSTDYWEWADDFTFPVLYSDHHFRIQGFIPEEVTWTFPSWGVAYEGDSRGWSPDGSGTSRSIMAGRFIHPRVEGNGFIEGPYYSVGLTIEYDKASSIDFNGHIIQVARDDWAWGFPWKMRWAQAPTDGMACFMVRESPTVERMECNESLGNPLFDLSGYNDITYMLSNRLEWFEPPDHVYPNGEGPDYTLTGCHDGYPNYEYYSDATTILQYDHFATGQTIYSLGWPCEFSVHLVGHIY